MIDGESGIEPSKSVTDAHNAHKASHIVERDSGGNVLRQKEILLVFLGKLGLINNRIGVIELINRKARI
jgi:hypothetical protein